MSRPLQGPGTALAQLDLQQIGWARAAAQRLMAHGFDAAIIPMRADEAGEWYCGNQMAFAPLAEPPPRGAPADALVTVLSDNEALLAEIERALGVAAEFSAYTPLPGDTPVITLQRERMVLARIAVFAPVAPLPAPPPPLLAQLICIAARVLIADAERLGDGDMLVLSHGPWLLVDEPGGLIAATGLSSLGFDPVKGTIAHVLAPSAHQGAPFAMSTAETPAGLSVPVAIHLADVVIAQSDLARLAETGTFDLCAVSEGLTATLTIGGRQIGQGEIVRLGDRFAVLLDRAEVEAVAVAELKASDPASGHDPAAAPTPLTGETA